MAGNSGEHKQSRACLCSLQRLRRLAAKVLFAMTPCDESLCQAAMQVANLTIGISGQDVPKVKLLLDRWQKAHCEPP